MLIYTLDAVGNWNEEGLLLALPQIETKCSFVTFYGGSVM
jgi:hypothetical protein